MNDAMEDALFLEICYSKLIFVYFIEEKDGSYLSISIYKKC